MESKKLGTALITGAAKRIGREIALYLAARGYDIVINYHKSQDDAQKLSKEIKEKYLVNCEIIAGDLSDALQVKNVAEYMIKNFPNWNLLINNASIFNKSKFLDAEELELFKNLNIHLIAPLILSKEFAKNVQQKNIKNAQIINMIDKNITRFETSYFYYLLSKKFLAEFTKMSALQLAPEVRVNGIAPGFILPEENVELRVFELEKKVPIRKQGEVKNIVQAIDFLLKNDFMLGEILFVDGGASLNHAG
jgi:pteridine reductase